MCAQISSIAAALGLSPAGEPTQAWDGCGKEDIRQKRPMNTNWQRQNLDVIFPPTQHTAADREECKKGGKKVNT